MQLTITRTQLLYLHPPYPYFDWSKNALLAWAATQGFDAMKPITLRREGSPTVYIFEQDDTGASHDTPDETGRDHAPHDDGLPPV